ncbi:MAG: hypothetical protein K0S18_1520 [Anaerocolumna sp.]|nr:hypothetical protein [Anaerocolumna sp.]
MSEVHEMYDNLKKLCNNLGIKLIYTSNKVIVLSAHVKNGIPYIRANKIFRYCSKAIAQNVIDYFITLEGKEIKEKVIETFIIKKLKQDKIKIKASDNSFKMAVDHNLPKSINKNQTKVLTEFTIENIIVKDFSGNEKTNSKDSILTPKDDDLLELDILIKPPVT